MKTIFFYLLLSCFFLSACNSSVSDKNPSTEHSEKAKVMQQAVFVPQEFDFQRIHIAHNYSLNTDTPETLGNSEAGMKEFDLRRNFIASSGFPIADPFILPTVSNYNWRQWDAKYSEFVERNKTNKFLPIFKRIGSMIILKDMGLLAGKSKEEKDKISFYTKELLANGGSSNSGIMYIIL
jgi:hypothetical protein